MAKTVTLFSPYSPDLGGGGTNLRTLIPQLRGVEVRWLYTAPRAATFPGTVRVDHPIAGGGAWRDLTRAVAVWSGIQTRTFRRVMAALTSGGSSHYWVIGHNEGIVVARALAKQGARVHLTIQDDVPDGMFGRSRRYRPLAPLVRPTYEATLRQMASVDVTSDGMQSYYRERLGLESVVVHPFVASLPPSSSAEPPTDEIRVGHIGSIYAVKEWLSFVRALREVARQRGVRARMLMIGLAAKYRPFAAGYADVVEIVDDLPEADAVARAAECHFLYAMYPFDPRSEVFRRTSLPTKVATYLKCRRPILAHSPGGSTLLDIVERYEIGVACKSVSSDAIEGAIRGVLAATVPRERFEQVREQVYGVGNVERLQACLEAL